MNDETTDVTQQKRSNNKCYDSILSNIQIQIYIYIYIDKVLYKKK